MAAPPTIAVIAAAAGCRLAKPIANLAAAAPNLRAPFSKTAANLTANLPIPVPNNRNAAKSLGPWSVRNLTTESTFFAFFGSPNQRMNLTRNLPMIMLIKKSRMLSRAPLTGAMTFSAALANPLKLFSRPLSLSFLLSASAFFRSYDAFFFFRPY